MSDQETKQTPEFKVMRESLYQKKAALQEIYETAISEENPPEATLELVVKLAKISGVYIEKKEQY